MAWPQGGHKYPRAYGTLMSWRPLDSLDVESADDCIGRPLRLSTLAQTLLHPLTAYGRFKPIQRMKTRMMDSHQVGNLTMCDDFMWKIAYRNMLTGMGN